MFANFKLMKRNAIFIATLIVGQLPASGLWVAAHRNELDTVIALLAGETDVNEVEDTFQETALHIACLQGNVDIVRVLLNAGVNVNQLDIRGESPLYKASRNGRSHVVDVLLEFRADVNQANNRGDTPLHAASGSGVVAVVLSLLHAGADVQQVDYKGRNLLYSSITHENIVQTLLDAGADVLTVDAEGRKPLYEAECCCLHSVANILKSAEPAARMRMLRGKLQVLALANRVVGSDLNVHDDLLPIIAQYATDLARKLLVECPQDVQDKCR